MAALKIRKNVIVMQVTPNQVVKLILLPAHIQVPIVITNIVLEKSVLIDVPPTDIFRENVLVSNKVKLFLGVVYGNYVMTIFAAKRDIVWLKIHAPEMPMSPLQQQQLDVVVKIHWIVMEKKNVLLTRIIYIIILRYRLRIATLIALLLELLRVKTKVMRKQVSRIALLNANYGEVLQLGDLMCASVKNVRNGANIVKGVRLFL
jgi:hypothetical protein